MARRQDAVEFVRFEFLCGHEGRENEDMIKGTMQQVSRGRQVNVLFTAILNPLHLGIVVPNSIHFWQIMAVDIVRR